LQRRSTASKDNRVTTIVECVLQGSNRSPSDGVLGLSGIHLADYDLEGPLIPPDVIEGVESKCDEDYARNVLRVGFDDPRKVRRQRLFVDGFLYRNLFQTGYLVVDRECDLTITLPDGNTTIFRVRDAVEETAMIDSLLVLCDSMPNETGFLLCLGVVKLYIKVYIS
jgi:hypothetical protein